MKNVIENECRMANSDVCKAELQMPLSMEEKEKRDRNRKNGEPK